MSTKKNIPHNDQSVNYNTFNHIIGLDIFKRRLEKDFYAEVSITNYGTNDNTANLSIQITCNLSLSETLFFLQNPIAHPCTTKHINWKKTAPFTKAYSDLLKKNTSIIDIGELSVIFTDTTIFISKIYYQSIPQQLEEIATTLCQHHIYYTKGLSEIPYEIFIPVFEVDNLRPDTCPIHHPLIEKNRAEEDYFTYWGVYNEFCIDAKIYSLQAQDTIKGDIQILN
ncbi:hypothetical protein [Arenibacter latericius]|uniref:hypothetical protein n=1 Tax=Arenibacter latericius TaxID=86104 RepID=UPI0003F69541|nr:hypothetical protein [Arenibacter latericius]MDX1363592.1 hypothetical protein [Arenibacter latericius]